MHVAGSTTLGPGLATVTGFLALPEERLVAHHRLVRMLGLHVLDIVVVVGHADHQAGCLPQVLTQSPQVVEHRGIPLRYASGSAWNGVSLSVRSLRPRAARPTLMAKNSTLNTTTRNSTVRPALV